MLFAAENGSSEHPEADLCGMGGEMRGMPGSRSSVLLGVVDPDFREFVNLIVVIAESNQVQGLCVAAGPPALLLVHRLVGGVVARDIVFHRDSGQTLTLVDLVQMDAKFYPGWKGLC